MTRYINKYTGEKVTVTGEFIVNRKMMVKYKKDNPQVIEKENHNGIVTSRKLVRNFIKPLTVFSKSYLPI